MRREFDQKLFDYLEERIYANKVMNVVRNKKTNKIIALVLYYHEWGHDMIFILPKENMNENKEKHWYKINPESHHEVEIFNQPITFDFSIVHDTNLEDFINIFELDYDTEFIELSYESKQKIGKKISELYNQNKLAHKKWYYRYNDENIYTTYEFIPVLFEKDDSYFYENNLEELKSIKNNPYPRELSVTFNTIDYYEGGIMEHERKFDEK